MIFLANINMNNNYNKKCVSINKKNEEKLYIRENKNKWNGKIVFEIFRNIYIKRATS